jgi:hypothetical protein
MSLNGGDEKSFVSRRNTLRMILNAPLMLPDAMVLVLLGDALGEVRGTSIKRWMMMRTRTRRLRIMMTMHLDEDDL